MSASPTSGELPLAEKVAAVRWYHTLELPGGIETPGEYDLRPILRRLPLPSDLTGKRCLDVGTHDGFWAFEMERRGAAEVVAIDLEDPERLDWPQPAPQLSDRTRASITSRKQAFWIAHRALNSAVDIRNMSVYDLASADLGHFDFATIGTLLLHLRDPVGALIAIRSVLRGELLVNEVISFTLSLLLPRRPVAKMLDAPGAPFWSVPNIAGLKRRMAAAGYRVRASGGPYLVPNGAGYESPPLMGGKALDSGLARVLMLRLGAPHAWVLAATAP